jgi:hypothetical protein
MGSSAKRYLPQIREQNFPFLTRDLYEVVDGETNNYNCIAFAAGDTTRWWEPDPWGVYFWPIPKREYTVLCFIEMFESLEYQKCKCSLKKRDLEKVAIYHDPVGCVATQDHAEVLPNSPTHAARQFPNGYWRSKLGPWELIEHKTLKCLNGTDRTGLRTSYGEPIQILKRPRA